MQEKSIDFFKTYPVFNIVALKNQNLLEKFTIQYRLNQKKRFKLDPFSLVLPGG